MAIGWFDGEIKPAGWFHQIAAGGTFDELLIAQSAGGSTITGTLAATDAADTAAFAGLIAHIGSLSATDGADTAEFMGSVDVVGAIQNTGGHTLYGGHHKDRDRLDRISPAYARAIIEAKLKTLAQAVPAKRKRRKTLEHAPVAIDSIAKQSEEFAKVEQKALVEKAVSEVLQMRSALDAEIKAEFAAIEIAQQLAVFEEEAIFMFLVASEA